MSRAKLTLPAVPVDGAPLQGYMTDKQVQALAIDPAHADQTIQDAAPLYGYVASHPQVTHDALVKWAASKWAPEAVDRLNRAVAFLQQAGRLHSLG